MGATRRLELFAAGEALGLDRRHITVLDEPRLPDGKRVVWNASEVARQVQKAVEADEIDTVGGQLSFGVFFCFRFS
jgi:hypothetical protein